MLPPGFQTARLILRPIEVGDADAIFDGYAQDNEVTRYMTWRPHRNISDAHAFIAVCLATPRERSLTYAITGRSDHRLRGVFELRRPAAYRLGYGYVLARQFWGQGLMSEALTAAVEWALAQSDVWRIGDVCDVDNLASARVMEKAGMTREALLRRWSMHPNVSSEPRDCFSYVKAR
jgi:[ribosomal protein S5]-alanine N-acetyltransferase